MTIDIESAIYGRSDRLTCTNIYRPRIKTTNCASRTSTDKVKQKCNGRRNCNMMASNSEMGGDPCEGTSKYLSVKYTCIGKSHWVILEYL